MKKEQKSIAQRLYTLLALTICTFFLFANYYMPENDFQNDSENLAVASIAYGRDHAPYSKYGLMNTSFVNSDETVIDTIKNYYAIDSIDYTDYISQIGFQGYVYQTISRLLCTGHSVMSIISLRKALTAMCAMLMAITAMSITYLVGKKHNTALAAAFYFTFLLSPWVSDFAQNLYWVEFTWYLPMVLGLIMSLDYGKFDKRWMYILITLSIAVKSACGYEYISTIMIGLIMFPVVDLILGNGTDRKCLFKIIVKMSICALLGFLVILTIHSFMRGGGNPLEGLKDIYGRDILRRTIISNPNVVFTDDAKIQRRYRASIEASVGEVLALYFEFKTPVLLGIGGKAFVPLVGCSTIVLLLRARKKENRWEIILFCMAFIATASWFVLGKSHSFIHTHMNYVLWYFGFVQMCLYSIICEIVYLIKN